MNPEDRKFWLALWTPTITVVGTVIVAVVSAWSGCTGLRTDVAGVKRAVDAQSHKIERIATRVDANELRSIAASKLAQDSIDRWYRAAPLLDRPTY